jgi:hypothetical protein
MITLRNMYKHTTQEVFDVCALHLLNQNERSVKFADSANCMYRGDNGLKCAIGILIPDEEYTENMEGNGVVRLTSKYGITDHVDMLSCLQSLHDEHDVSNWQEKLIRLAHAYYLSDERIANFGEI